MQLQAGDGNLITPAAMAARIDRSDRDYGWPDGHYAPFLATIAGLGALPAQAVHYADAVLGESYRRQYFAMVTYLDQIAREAPEEDLFPELVVQGTLQRAARDRRLGFMEQLHASAEG